MNVPKEIPVVEVTPELAKEWLDTRFDNERYLRKGRIQAMVRNMTAGKWFFIGDPIRFDQEGRLIDGQHRLTALVEADVTLPFAIINLPSEARAVIDTGSARSLGDLLTLGDHVGGKVLAAIVRRVLTYNAGMGAEGGTYYPTVAEGIEFVNENKDDLYRAWEVAAGLYRKGQRFPMAPASIGAAYFLCAEKDRKLADNFFGKLINGLHLEEGEPVVALRNRALRIRETEGRPMTADNAFRFTVVAWNLTREGATVYRLMTPKGGWTQQNAPRVK